MLNKQLKFCIYGLLILIVFANPLVAYSFSDEIDNTLTTEVEKSIKKLNIPGVNVGIWVESKGQWIGSFGVANKETNEKLRLDHHFRIGSITKTFTVTAILQLYDKGLLSLDDTISKYVDNVPNGNKITLRHLANMTSGLPSYTENEKWVKEDFLSNLNRVWHPQELLEVAFSMPILFKPGKKFHYSNTNTILLGIVIEKVSGLRFDEYLEKNIFNPLALKDTYFPLNEKMPKPYAHGYTKQTLDGLEADATFINPSWAFAAGQIVSNFYDLKKWAEALGTGKLLSKAAFKQRLTWLKMPPNTQKKKYGLGIGFDNGWLTHTGALPGYNSIAAYLPEQKAIFVCLVNSDIPTEISEKEIPPAPEIFKVVTRIITPKNVPIE